MEQDASSLFIGCARCGAKNRVPRTRLTDDPVCGQCQQPLLPGEPVELGDANFDQLVRNTQLPIVVDFWAPWCGPCKMMAPQFDQAARALKGKALLVKLNSDDNPRTSSRFQVRSIPTLVRLNGGAEVKRQAGALPAAQIIAFAS